MKSSHLKARPGLLAGVLLLVSVILVGCYNPQDTPVGGYPPAYTGGPQATPSGLESVNAPSQILVPPVNSVTPVLRVGDMVIIEWFDTVNPIQPYKERIRDDGKLVLIYNVVVHAAGKTTAQLQDDIRTAYVPKLYNHLTVSVKTEDRVYFVGGEVRINNRQIYQDGITVLRAIDTAGGFTDFANRNNIEVRRQNGEIVKVKWKDAMKNPKLDPPVYPNDQIIVRKRIL